MTSHVKLRKEKVGLVDYDTQIKGKMVALKWHSSRNPSLFITHTILTVINMCSLCGKTQSLNPSKTFRMSHILSCMCFLLPVPPAFQRYVASL